MTRDEFTRATVLFSEAFPKTEFNPRLWWPIVAELDGEVFFYAVGEYIKTVKNIYPGSNHLATLIEKHDELIFERRKMRQKRLSQESDLQRIERWKREMSPPPPEWQALKKKLSPTRSHENEEKKAALG